MKKNFITIGSFLFLFGLIYTLVVYISGANEITIFQILRHPVRNLLFPLVVCLLGFYLIYKGIEKR